MYGVLEPTHWITHRHGFNLLLNLHTVAHWLLSFYAIYLGLVFMQNMYLKCGYLSAGRVEIGYIYPHPPKKLST